MRELTWLEEHFRDEAIAIGEARGKERSKEYAVSAAIEFMRSSGMSHELINNFRKSIK